LKNIHPLLIKECHHHLFCPSGLGFGLDGAILFMIHWIDCLFVIGFFKDAAI
jgi:hypothetical protein